jgi:hypothetical protein
MACLECLRKKYCGLFGELYDGLSGMFLRDLLWIVWEDLSTMLGMFMSSF